jgi:hypothetical protein
MRVTWQRKALMLLAAGAILAGVIIAVLTIPGGKHDTKRRARLLARSGTLVTAGQIATASKYIGISTKRLRSEIQAGKSLAEIAAKAPGRSPEGLAEALIKTRVARVDRELAAGDVSKTVAKQRIARIRTRAEQRIERSSAATSLLAVAADYLGISAAQLRARERAGQSLAQIAQATPGRSPASLIKALVLARETQLARMVSDGAITAARSKALRASVEQRVRAEVEAAVPRAGSGAR